jgi:hypothetical protein
MSEARRLQAAKVRKEDYSSRRLFRTLAGPVCLICLTAIGAVLLSSPRAGPDLFDLVPKVPKMNGYLLLAWPGLERKLYALDAEAISSGALVRALGYMTDGDQPVRDGASVENFVLLPDAGTPLHPAHRHGDQMIAVRLESGNTIRFSERRLLWVWGTLRVLPGDSEGREPLYVLENARAETAIRADMAKYFR